MPFRKPHPIRGILWGLIMGIGAAVIAILLKIIPFDLVWAADRARRRHPARHPVEHARSGEEAQGRTAVASGRTGHDPSRLGCRRRCRRHHPSRPTSSRSSSSRSMSNRSTSTRRRRRTSRPRRRPRRCRPVSGPSRRPGGRSEPCPIRPAGPIGPTARIGPATAASAASAATARLTTGRHWQLTAPAPVGLG